MTAITDGTGNVVERYEYADFGQPADPVTGQPIYASPSAIGNPYTYLANNPWTGLDPMGLGWVDMAEGMAAGLASGAWEAVTGLPKLAWNLFWHPVATVQGFYEGVAGLASAVAEGDLGSAAEQLFPEIYRLATSWNELGDYEAGELIGKVVGEKGTSYFTGGAIAKVLKQLKSFKAAQKAKARTPATARATRKVETAKATGAGKPPQSPPPKPNGGGSCTVTPCFAAGTLVAVENGLKPIEEIRAGETVLAYCMTTLTTVQRRVLEVSSNFTYYWIDVTVAGKTITATRWHRFWVESEWEWIEAINLKSGMLVRLKSGDLLPIERVELRELNHTEPTYNFVVDQEHNYFAGSDSILVHNGLGRLPGGDVSAHNYVEDSINFASRLAAEQYARRVVGPGAVQIRESIWQQAGEHPRARFRIKPGDLIGHTPGGKPHIHLEKLDKSGAIRKNLHLKMGKTWMLTQRVKRGANYE